MRIPLPKQYHQTIDLRYKGKKIRTYVFGRGQKKVLSLPAFPHSGLIYLYLLLHYNLDRIQFISFDLPGWIGESENIYEKSLYSEDETMNLLEKIISHYNLINFSIIGFSFGTTLATRLLEKYPEGINKIALVSPILKGLDVDDKSIRNRLKFINRFHAYELVKKYVQHRFRKYRKYLASTGMEQSVIDQYARMLNNSDAKVLFTSLNHLYTNDYSQYIKNFNNKDILIVNSKEETPYFRKQAGHIRHILNGEKSIFLHGNHEDFVLRPQAEVVKQVIDFLIK